jgi:hypothetical protein
MRIDASARGFELLVHPEYVNPTNELRLVSQSSAIGDCEGDMQHPGSSFLWIGDHHHLDRSEVRELAQRLNHWLETGSLEIKENKIR